MSSRQWGVIRGRTRTMRGLSAAGGASPDPCVHGLTPWGGAAAPHSGFTRRSHLDAPSRSIRPRRHPRSSPGVSPRGVSRALPDQRRAASPAPSRSITPRRRPSADPETVEPGGIATIPRARFRDAVPWALCLEGACFVPGAFEADGPARRSVGCPDVPPAERWSRWSGAVR